MLHIGLKYHLAWYRKDVLSGEVSQRLKEVFQRMLKNVSARKVLKNFQKLRKQLWAGEF